ncbi:MAG: Integrase catalytic region [Eubacterium sp.]|jgi:transposase|nr:Integrase catalytic region [Eubacterium sp.]
MSNEKTHPIRQDYLNGMTYKAVSLKYQIDVRTAKRYVQLNLPLSNLEQRPFNSVLDPYKQQIDLWLSAEKIYASTVFDWLVSEGCTCGYTIVNKYVQEKIREYEEAGYYRQEDKKVRHVQLNKSIFDKSKEEKNYVNSRNG